MGLLSASILSIVFTAALAQATIEVLRIVSRSMLNMVPDYGLHLDWEATRTFTDTFRPIGHVCSIATLVLIAAGVIFRFRPLSLLHW